MQNNGWRAPEPSSSRQLQATKLVSCRVFGLWEITIQNPEYSSSLLKALFGEASKLLGISNTKKSLKEKKQHKFLNNESDESQQKFAIKTEI